VSRVAGGEAEGTAPVHLLRKKKEGDTFFVWTEGVIHKVQRGRRSYPYGPGRGEKEGEKGGLPCGSRLEAGAF